jgi:hypothetical protein
VYHVAVSSTALLFFFRVRAIFNNTYITASFFILWLAVLGASLTAVVSLSGVHIGTTEYCMFSNFKPYRSSGNIAFALFDTCVFVAITWRVVAGSSKTRTAAGEPKGKPDLFGRYLPAFSRALLQDGQNYYLYVLFFKNNLVYGGVLHTKLCFYTG